MSWFSKTVTEVRKTEAELALELVKLTGEAHVAAIVKAAEVAGKKLIADAITVVTAAQQMVAKDLVAKAQATAQAAVAASTKAATPAV